MKNMLSHICEDFSPQKFAVCVCINVHSLEMTASLTCENFLNIFLPLDQKNLSYESISGLKSSFWVGFHGTAQITHLLIRNSENNIVLFSSSNVALTCKKYIFLFKYPRFILYLDNFLKQRTN